MALRLLVVFVLGWSLACSGGGEPPEKTECHSADGYSVIVGTIADQALPNLMIKEGDDSCAWGGTHVALLQHKAYRDMGGGMLVTNDGVDGSYASTVEIWNLLNGELQSSHQRVSTGHADPAVIKGDKVVIGGYDLGLSKCGKKKAKKPTMCPGVFEKCWGGFKAKGGKQSGFDVSDATSLACRHDAGTCNIDVTATVHVPIGGGDKRVVGAGTCRLVP